MSKCLQFVTFEKDLARVQGECDLLQDRAAGSLTPDEILGKTRRERDEAVEW